MGTPTFQIRNVEKAIEQGEEGSTKNAYRHYRKY
jgi:hypothetical protein